MPERMGYNFSLLKQVFFYLTLCVASYAAAHNLCGPNDQPSLSLSANYLFINDTALMPGDSQDIPLLIYLEESSRGLQFDVTIPSEFSFVLADLETDPILANFSVTSSDLGNGTYRIIVFTFGSSTLPIGAYPIFYMPVTVDNAALPGFYAFPLTNVTISGTNNQNIATTALVQGFIEILGNNAPVASGQSVSTDEDTMIQITLEATDVDGDPLTYTIVTQPANGTAVLTGNTVDYTPDGNYNGPDSFTFTANDGTTDSNTATVSIDVTPVNDAPVASDQSVTTDEDTMIQITLVATDVDGDPLTYSIVDQPTNGTAVLTGNTVDYIPDGNYNGPDSFTFKANDGTTDSNTASVSIDVILGISDLVPVVFSLAPNPFQDHLEVVLPMAATIYIYGVDGKMIEKIPYYTMGIRHLELISYPRGVFFIKFQYSGGSKTMKLIKN
jgi:hypothetical protein